MDSALWGLIGQSVIESLYITLVSTLCAYIIGLPLGILLVVTNKNGIKPLPVFNSVLGFVVNFFRSVPFIILMVFIVPFTRLVVGSAIGTNATIVPLVVAAAPFVGRMVESSIMEVDNGVIEAAQSMGASPWRIVFRVMLPEAKPSLLTGAAIAITTILSYSAMAGICGGGGLGAVAINYGYYRYQYGIMFVCIVILVVIVQVFQEFGMRLCTRTDKRNN